MSKRYAEQLDAFAFAAAGYRNAEASQYINHPLQLVYGLATEGGVSELKTLMDGIFGQRP